MTFNYATESEKIKNGFEHFFRIYDETNSLVENNKSFYQERRQFLSRLKQPEFRIVILGIANTGKSTILNTLLERDLLSEDNNITTAYPTLIKYAEDKKDEERRVFFINHDVLYKQVDFLIKEIVNKINEANIAQKISKANGTETNEINTTLEKELRNAYYKNDAQSDLSAIIRRELGESQSVSSEIDLIKKKLEIIASSEENNDIYKKLPLPSKPTLNKGNTPNEERNPESILYKNEECYIKDDRLKDITIVDLPGLTDNNERHSIATIDYITQNANLILLCLPYDDTLNLKKGVTVLESIINQAPEIHKASSCILIKNKFDKITLDSQEEESDKDIKDILRQVNINFRKEYRFSAKHYKIIYNFINSKNETNTDEILKLYDITSIEQAKRFLTEHKHVREFTNFKQYIFDLIETKAKKEFLENVHNNLILIIENYLAELNKSIRNTDQSTPEDIANEISFREFNIIHEHLKTLINKKLCKIIREERNIVYINESDLEEIKNNIKKIISQKDEIIDYMTRGLDNTGTFSQIHAFIVNSLLENNPFREKIHEKVKKEFYDHYLELFDIALFNTLDIRGYELDLKEKIKSITNINHLEIRISGTLDVLIPSYMENLNKMNYTPANGITRDEHINAMIQAYIDLLIKNLENFIAEINKQLHITVKNYLETLKKEFDKTLGDSETKQILRINLKDKIINSEKVQEEIKKQSKVKEALDKLIKLEKTLNESNKSEKFI